MKKRFKIEKEFGSKWIEALLNTPEEKHGTGEYYSPSDDCYCAMGLGLKVNGYEFEESGLRVKGIDPFEKVNKLGHNELWHAVYPLNDQKKLTFCQIADWIEANVELI